MNKKRLYLIIISMIAVIGVVIIFHVQFKISGVDLQKQVSSIIEEKIISGEILYGDKPVESNSSITIQGSQSNGLLTVFSGFIENEKQSVKFVISFKKHPFFKAFLFDTIITTDNTDLRMEFSTSYGTSKYNCKVPQKDFSITITKTHNYLIIIRPIIFLLMFFSFRAIRKRRRTHSEIL